VTAPRPRAAATGKIALARSVGGECCVSVRSRTDVGTRRATRSGTAHDARHLSVAGPLPVQSPRLRRESRRNRSWPTVHRSVGAGHASLPAEASPLRGDRHLARDPWYSRENRPIAAISCAIWSAPITAPIAPENKHNTATASSLPAHRHHPSTPASRRSRAQHLPIGVFAQFPGQIARSEPGCRSGWRTCRARPRRAQGAITRSPRSAQKTRNLQHEPLITCRPGDRAPGAPSPPTNPIAAAPSAPPQESPVSFLSPRCHRCNRPLNPGALPLHRTAWPVFCGQPCASAWTLANSETRRPGRRRGGRQVRARRAAWLARAGREQS